jgi:hypothetical protein
MIGEICFLVKQKECILLVVEASKQDPIWRDVRGMGGPGDAVLDAGNQLICCYGRRSTGQQYGVCLLCD